MLNISLIPTRKRSGQEGVCRSTSPPGI